MVDANTKLQIKNNFIKILITLTFGMLLVSCGMPTTVITRGEATVVDKERIIMQGLALDTYYKRYEKLSNLTYPLLTKSTEFCGKRVTYDIGLKTISLNQIDKRFRKAAEEKLFITEKQKVLFTINNSPSDQAGIKSGDIISEINVANKKWINDDIFQNNEKKNYSEKIVKISVIRKAENLVNNAQDELIEFEIIPNKICNYGVVDNLDKIGGQCIELYPDKPIYDIPGVPFQTAQEHVDALIEQIKPFKYDLYLNQRVDSLNEINEDNDNYWEVTTNENNKFISKNIFIAAGAGSFEPRRPN